MQFTRKILIKKYQDWQSTSLLWPAFYCTHFVVFLGVRHHCGGGCCWADLQPYATLLRPYSVFLCQKDCNYFAFTNIPLSACLMWKSGRFIPRWKNTERCLPGKLWIPYDDASTGARFILRSCSLRSCLHDNQRTDNRRDLLAVTERTLIPSNGPRLLDNNKSLIHCAAYDRHNTPIKRRAIYYSTTCCASPLQLIEDASF